LLLVGLCLGPAGVLSAQVAQPGRPSSAATSPTKKAASPPRTAEAPEPASRKSSSKQPAAAIQYLIALGALVLVLVIVCVPTREAD
jgi:hypothetical protein